MQSSVLLLCFLASCLSGEVVITSFPSSGWIIRNEPFLLSCTAINAISIRFRCNHKWMDESRQVSTERVDNSTGLRYLQSSISITGSGKESEERCDCYGVGSGERTVKSDMEAVISTAFMRKHFEQTPSSLQIKEGSQVALPCVPPLSHPPPTIEWTRNGELITPDNYRIMASDGSLILSSARLHDAGMYVCTATNVAATRSTPPASIHVYVDDLTPGNILDESGGPGIHPMPREETGSYPIRPSRINPPPPVNRDREHNGEGMVPCPSGICPSQWSLSDRVVVVSLFAVFLLFSVLFSLCILLLCRQKTQPKTQQYYADVASYKSGVIVEGMGPRFVQSPLPSMTILSTKSGYARCESGVYSMSRGGESRQALLEGSSTASSARKAFLTTNSSLSEEEDNYATVYECVRGGEMVEGDCVLPARVDRDGGRLSMDKNRTHLLVGEASLDCPTLVILSTRSPSDDLPMMDDGEIAVSSLISVSSSSTSHPRFPFILSFTHALQSVEQWTVSLYSHSHYGWDRYDVDSDNTSPSPIFTHFDSIKPSLIHCAIPHYGKFLLCARPKKSNPVLRMRVSVFAPIDRRESFPLRVVIVAEGAGMSREEDGERLVAESSMGVVMDGGPLCVCLEETSTSFTAHHNYTEMDLSTEYSHSFHIQSIDRNEPFSARLVFIQKRPGASPHILSVSLDDDYDQLVMTEDTRVSLDFLLPHTVKQRIASLLDPPSERDWVSLARSLGAPAFVVFGRALASPTTVLLTLWEARREDPCHLSHALRLSGRPEVAQMIDKYVAQCG